MVNANKKNNEGAVLMIPMLSTCLVCLNVLMETQGRSDLVNVRLYMINANLKAEATIYKLIYKFYKLYNI